MVMKFPLFVAEWMVISKMYRENGIEIYSDYKNHPISYAISRIPGLCIFSNIFRYHENGWRINQIIEKVNQHNP